MIQRETWARAMLFLCAGVLFSGASGALFAATGEKTGAQAALQAERDWTRAAARNDATGMSAALDEQFAWTDVHGATRTRAQAMKDLAALAADNQSETDLKTFHYGHVEVITGVHRDARFMRVWVELPAGWRAFAIVDTGMAGGVAPFSTAASGGGDCENPCRAIPYKPATAADQAIVGILERLKMDEWHPNPDDWARYVIDDVSYVSSAAALSKADRVAHLAEQKKSGGAILPGDPVISMQLFDFGPAGKPDAAVMITRNAPYRGGKPYYSVRVWTLRDGRWQLANSQQTTIEGAAAVAAVGSR
jgi:hypothetical protein